MPSVRSFLPRSRAWGVRFPGGPGWEGPPTLEQTSTAPPGPLPQSAHLACSPHLLPKSTNPPPSFPGGRGSLMPPDLCTPWNVPTLLDVSVQGGLLRDPRLPAGSQ